MKAKLAIILAAMAAAAYGDGTSLRGKASLWVQAEHSKTTGTTVVSATYPDKLLNYAFRNGTNDYQMTALVVRTIELSGLSTNIVDLQAETNAFGDAVTFTRVNLLCVSSRTNSAGKVIVGGDNFSAIFNDDDAAASALLPGGSVVFAAPVGGYEAGASDRNLKLSTPTTNAATVDIYIGGVAE